MPAGRKRRQALAEQLLDRHGVVTREAVHAEGIPGSFSAVYEILKTMEEAGRVRRGYFVTGLGATQFARPGADEQLRALREPAVEAELTVLAATDPANPYGAALAWPPGEPRPQRVARATVWLRDGALLAYLGRTERSLFTYLPAEEPARTRAGRELAQALSRLVDGARRRALLITSIDGQPPGKTALAGLLIEAGFTAASRGYLRRSDSQRARR